MRDLTILLPTRNERNGLKSVLLDLAFLDIKPHILVVDTNSTDGTLEIARDFGVEVIKEPRRGKGVALITGFSLVQTPYVIMMDSDGSYPVEFLESIYNELKQGWDVVLGNRKIRVNGSMSKFHSFGNMALSYIATCLYGKRVDDVCTGMKGFNTLKIANLGLECKGFEIEAEIFAKAVRKHLSIKEIDITYQLREGKPKLNGLRDGLKIGVELIRGRLVH